MSLNITNLLNTLKGYYNPDKNAGQKYTGEESGLANIISASGLTSGALETVTLTENNLSNTLLNEGLKIIVSSKVPSTFSYKIDNENGKIIIFGNNLTIEVNEFDKDMIEIVGISNNVKTTTGDDKVTLLGFDNKVNTDDGEDNVTVHGDDNEINAGDGEDYVTIEGNNNVNIFKGVSGNYLIIDDKEFLVSLNPNTKTNNDTSSLKINYDENSDKIDFEGNDISIISQSDTTENISLKGNNNYIETGVGDDEITISGNENIVISGEGEDNISVSGKNNQITGDENDEVHYTATSGTITLTPEDRATHYIELNGAKFEVKRNEVEGETENQNITFSYKLTENGIFEFSGNYFSLTEQNDGVKDNVKITGNHNTVDTGDGNDKIRIIGDNNIVHAGEGDDSVSVSGNNNDIQGDSGDNDSYAVTGEGNTVEGFEQQDKIFTLSSEKEAEIVEIDGKTYTISLTDAAKKAGKEVLVTAQNLSGTLVVEADDIVITARDSQEDKITLYGSNSKIFAMDKNDEINVIGDNNFIDGWSGDDKITATGIGNKAYGFLGNDEINIIQRENTEAEVEAAGEEVYSKLSENEKASISDEEFEKKVTEHLNEKSANIVDGEFDTDTVNAPKNTKISADTEIYKSLAQSVIIKPDESEKKIVVDGKTYTIKNYITTQNNNPFISNRTISYDIVHDDVSDKDILVIKGNYISVVADDGQEDNVRVIGNNNYLDLGDMDDYLEAEGKHNLLFSGTGSDYIKVTGSNTTVNSSKDNMVDFNDENKIEVYGDENVIVGGEKSKDTLYVEGNNSTWKNVEIVDGSYNNKETLNNTVREKTVRVNDGKVYTFKLNIADNETINSSVQFGYKYENGTLTVDGDKIQVIAAAGQQDNIVLNGKDCVINLGDGNDKIEATGSRNTIYGGAGDDEITVLGESFNVFAEAGNDKVTANAVNSTINGGTGANTLELTNPSQNTQSGFSKVNQVTNKGLVVLTPNRTTGTISVNLNGQNITYNVSKNSVPVNQKVSDEIYVQYEIKDVEIVDISGATKTVQQLVIEGNNVVLSMASQADWNKTVYAKIIGDNISFETARGDDFIDVEGNNNSVYGNSGQNTISVAGNNNNLYGSEQNDTFVVLGDNNKIYGQGGDDNFAMEGVNNTFKIIPDGEKKGGSIVLSKKEGPQLLGFNVNGKNRTYRLSMYGISEDELNTAAVNIQYYVDSNGYTTFVGEHFKVEVMDSSTTESTDLITTDNKDSLRLIGNNCYIVGGHGSDALKVEGNNNIIDGWYGDDSFEVIGNNNQIRGFDGDDIINVNGNNNEINGEAGYDTLTILGGENNKDQNIEKINKKN